MSTKGKIQSPGIASKLTNTVAGRGLGPGRYHVPHEFEGIGEGASASPLRHQARLAEATSTGQGCELHVVSVQQKKLPDGEEEAEPQDGEMSWEQALYHVGWWTGLNHVKWCEMIDSHPSGAGKEHILPQTPTHCRQNDALQGAMMSPRMLPIRDLQMQFMSCMDGRAEYAVAGTFTGSRVLLYRSSLHLSPIYPSPYSLIILCRHDGW